MNGMVSRPRHGLSLCAGGGGLDLGLMLAEPGYHTRRGYEDWCQALSWVRDGLLAGGMLREVEVTAVMPKVRPWLASSRK